MALPKFYPIFCLILLALAACEVQPPETQIEFATANAVMEVEETSYGCEYQNGSLCEEECCYYDSSCDGDSYRKCNIVSGEWSFENYSDSLCSKECQEKAETVTEEDRQKTKKLLEEMIELQEQDACLEGWVCINSSFRGYQSSDCSILHEAKCEKGCKDSKCNKICEEGALKCRSNKLVKCTDGYKWETEEVCSDGCENSACIGAEDEEEQSNETQGEQPMQECGSCIEFLPDQSNFTGTVSCSNSIYLEFVSFKSECGSECSIFDWKLNDDSNTTFIVPEFSLNPGASVRIITGKGTNTQAELYWGRCSAVWNNGGDSVYLRNRNNEIVVEHRYP